MTAVRFFLIADHLVLFIVHCSGEIIVIYAPSVFYNHSTRTKQKVNCYEGLVEVTEVLRNTELLIVSKGFDGSK